MAADIFGAGLDRQVDAFFQRLEIERARPGVVHQHQRAVLVRDRGDGRDVLHLEVSEPGASVNTARVFGCISAAMPAPISGS